MKFEFEQLNRESKIKSWEVRETLKTETESREKHVTVFIGVQIRVRRNAQSQNPH